MKIWGALSAAFTGWMKILRGDASWQQHFAITPAGLATALVIFVFFALVSIAIAAIGINAPTLPGLAAGLVVQCLSILALLIGALVTRRAVPVEQPLLALLVPGLYGLVCYLVLGTVFSMFGGAVLLVLWLGLGYLFYRLARMAAQWSLEVSIAFAVLTMALLVGMPMTLYMLTGPVAAPAL
ncbi:hypothetical protein [Devosia sp. SD17-2]|uniref:hypothetical protein n=1 Tax=Devosia sp. SD17-2 TaxID=2976459 RepID=UPI0023D8AFA8|nr:hypothetical protein [Devosia sp. SD17-2]WEJ32651.1 hypothetical protein NYQ88_17450 [Devosia sp. SD17-2]